MEKISVNVSTDIDSRLGRPIFNDIVKPLLQKFQIRYHSIETARRGHAKELLETLDLTEYVGLILVSGDGMISEVLHGLSNRFKQDKDHSEFLQFLKAFPLGIVPAGNHRNFGGISKN